MATETPTKRSYRAAVTSFEDGTSSPRDFLEDCLAAMDKLEPDIGAFVATNIDGARKAADEASARWKSGKTLSLIDGMPLCIKDIMETADMRTNQVAFWYALRRSGVDARVVGYGQLFEMDLPEDQAIRA